MRTSYNRQTRRAARCIRARSARTYGSAVSSRRAALAAHGDELVAVAARIAQELELSPEMIDELLWGPATEAAPDAEVRPGTMEARLAAPDGGIRGR